MLIVWKPPRTEAGRSRHSQNVPFSPIPAPTKCTDILTKFYPLEDVLFPLHFKAEPQRTYLYLAMRESFNQ